MTEAPERIWAESPAGRWNSGTWSRSENDLFADARCFVRADVADAMLAALKQIGDASENAEDAEMAPAFARIIAKKARFAIAKAEGKADD